MNGSEPPCFWSQRLPRKLIQRASQALPTYDRERYREEWQAELDAHPGGSMRRVGWALGLLLLRRMLARALGARPGILSRIKGFDFAMATRALALAPRDDQVDVVHGYRVADPYRWLEDPHTVDALRWQTAQDELFEAHRAAWPSRESFRSRVGGLLATGVVGPPAWRGERQFFMRRHPGQEHAVLYVKDTACERALVDPLSLDPSGVTTLDGWHPSKEGNLLAYRVSRGGTEESDLYVLDVTTGEIVDGPIDRTRSSTLAWLPGEKAFYYVRRLAPDQVPPGEAQYHRRVWLHRVGSSADDDVLVFGAGLHKTTFHGVSVSDDNAYLIVSSREGTARRNNIWLANLADAPEDAPTFVPMQLGADATTTPRVRRDGKMYVHTNLDAPRGRLCVTDPTTPTAEHWQTLIEERPDAVLEGYAILDGPELETPVLLANWTCHAVSRITAHELTTGEQFGTVLDTDLGTVGTLVEHPDGGPEVWFSYTDYATPPCVWRYDARTSTCGVWAKPPGSTDLPNLETRQVEYESADGTTVRMFVLSQSGQPVTPRPALLYAYGGFNISLTPSYSPSALAWVEAGGVYAIANVRGGGEEGEEWHRAALLANRYKVYEDFEAAADWLVDNGWTTNDQLVISGSSNGGLLVGAAVTRRPEAYRAAVCSAPLLDMMRYEHTGLGELWTNEYGTVNNPEHVGWLLSHSPYHQVRTGASYPAVLFTVFEGDSRVDPMHSRKMAAALQHATTADCTVAPIVLRREAEVGHSQRAVSRSVDLAADTLGFAAWTTAKSCVRPAQGGPASGSGP
jgi:prolyl oligopeptidase